MKASYWLVLLLVCTVFVPGSDPIRDPNTDVMFVSWDPAATRLALAGCPSTPTDPHVVLISSDGTRPDAITSQGQQALPNFYRFVDGGAGTDNARTIVEATATLPDHLSMVTGVGVDGPSGHHVTFDDDDGRTVHDAAGRYVSSVFDVVHDNCMSTSLFAGKPKFDFLDRSWDADHGAPDLIGIDNGTDKIDMYQRGGGPGITAAVVSQLTTQPAGFTMVHYAAPDYAGHRYGWESPKYLAAVREVDAYIGTILDAIEADPDLAANTVVILTADHGGTGFSHSNWTLPLDYTIPFYVWGGNDPQGASLYAMNSAARADPGTGQPDYTDPNQPIRNADVANLVTMLLGLGPIPGSTINAAQDLSVTAAAPRR